MKTLTLDGCWYTDARPNGSYVAARFGRGGVETELGGLDGPEIQWTRAGPGLRFAGTGANDSFAHEYTGTVWENRGVFKAPRAVIYLADGSLKVERDGGWPGPGAQGWRFVDDAGNLIPAWSTRTDTQRQIYEYTTRRDVTIGQGGSGGVEALVDGKRIRLDHLFRNLDGSLRFGDAPNTLAVNFNRDGDSYAVSWYVAHSSTSYTACIVWITDAELRALPEVSVPVPPPGPPPPPPPPPPIEDPMPAYVIPEELTPDHTEVARATRPVPYIDTMDGNAEWAKRFARELKRRYPHLPIGLAQAKGGSENHGGADSLSPMGYTTDVIALKSGVHWDFKADNGVPLWILIEDPGNYPPIADRFVPIEDVPGGTVPIPGPPPGPPPPPTNPPVECPGCAALALRLDALSLRLDNLTRDVLANTGRTEVLLQRVDRLEELATSPPPPGTPFDPFDPAKYQTSSGGGGWWGKSHVHQIERKPGT